MKTTRLISINVLCLSVLVGLPVHAAQITAALPVRAIAPKAPFTITVSVTTDTAKINVIQGGITIPEGVTVDQVSTAGTSLSLWPTVPAYSIASGEVTFFGGTPYGIPANTTAALFTIRAHADVPGTYEFKPVSTEVYKDDGKGTSEVATTLPVTVEVQPGVTSSGVVAPGQPQPLVATIGRDASLFSGKYFVTFYGGDRGAGIVTYEVQEGSGAFTPANRYYVLSDQSLSTKVTVRAIDPNGVAAETMLPAMHPPQSSGTPWVYAIAIVVAILGIWFILIRKRKRT